MNEDIKKTMENTFRQQEIHGDATKEDPINISSQGKPQTYSLERGIIKLNYKSRENPTIINMLKDHQEE